jgi:arabinofuranosyltransferase
MSPKVPTARRLLSWGLALLAVAVFVWHARVYWGWTEDDAFISFRYAHNLAGGDGLVFNPGERVEGYSNLSWVLGAAAALRAGLDPEQVAKVAGLLAGALTVLLSWRLARRLMPQAGPTALLAPWYLAVSPVLARNAVNGLETGFFALLLVSAMLLALGATAPLRRLFLLAILGLMSVTRPEGPLLALVVLALRVVFAGRPAETPAAAGRRATLADIAIYAGLYGAYFMWRWSYFAAPLPNVFYAKMTGGLAGVAAAARYSLDFMRDAGGALIVGLALAPVVLGRARASVWLALTVLVAYACFVLASGGDWMYHYRYYAHVLPVLAASIAAGMDRLLAQARLGATRVAVHASLALVLLATFAAVIATELESARLTLPAIRAHHYLSQNYQELGRWFHDHTPPGTWIAISDVGAVAYFSERPILDMFGLMDPHIAHLRGRMHYKADAEHVLARRPDYVVLVSRDDQGAGRSFLRIPDARMFALPAFHQQYELVRIVPQEWENETALVYRRRG